MYARLAFSVAIHVDADILLVDEILGVGDINFQAKCANKIYEMKRNRTTIILVTHDISFDYRAAHSFAPPSIFISGHGPPSIAQDERTKAHLGAKGQPRSGADGSHTFPRIDFMRSFV